MRVWRSSATRVAAVALIASLFVIPGTASAAEWDDVEFDGAGWGHGVGMSQYGAYAMATLGSDYQAILTHYYQGTQIETMDPLTTLWVNLERNFSTKTLDVEDVTSGVPGADVTITWEGGTELAQSGAEIAIATSGSDGCVMTLSNPSSDPIVMDDPDDCSFDMEWYEWDTGLGVPTTKVAIQGCSLADWNDSPTNYVQCQYALGMMHLRSGPGGLDLSAEMLMDDYILGISEMPYYWTEIDALRVQAVAARSYAEARRIVRGDPASNSCDGWCHVKDTTADQRYVGWGHSNTASWVTATETTALEILTHEDSTIGVIAAYYSSSTGGATEFGHVLGYSSGPVEWLTSVDDSWAIDGTVYNPNSSWTVTKTAAQVAAAVGLDYLTGVEVIETRPGSGSASQVEFQGILNGSFTSYVKTGGWVDATFGLKSMYFDVEFRAPGDEMFFYRSTDGKFAYYDVQPDGTLSSAILTGTGYSTGWSSIASIDLEGDGQDEMFFYRETDGAFRYYDINPDATLGAPILTGTGYSLGWSSITSVDLDGDGQDEIFFYRETDGAYRYYQINPDGSLGAPVVGGLGYSTGWSSISAIDLDGDGQDEMFFYRAADGAYRYYQINPDGSLGAPVAGGVGYSTDWSSITAVDLDGDGQDEIFFYRGDRTYSYYDIQPDASLGAPIKSGTYANLWTTIVSVDLDGQ